jgi:hypothetical protein
MDIIKNLLRRIRNQEIQDPNLISNTSYNEAAGAIKQIIVEPVVKSPVDANTQIPFGSYVKVTGTSYTLRLLGKNHDTGRTYRKYDLAVQGGRVYIANQNGIKGAFDATLWTDVAPSTVGPVTITAGSVVCCGKYHNNINAAGFLIDDDSEIKKSE